MHGAGVTIATYFESTRANPVFSAATSFRGRPVESFDPLDRPPSLATLVGNSKRLYPGDDVSLPAASIKALADRMSLQNGSYADVVGYFQSLANGSDLHVLYGTLFHLNALDCTRFSPFFARALCQIALPPLVGWASLRSDIVPSVAGGQHIGQN